mmetsp:Transcript_10208/g.62285  ORF Transcript_10208/g.62285 Transcript_10208/m.62285 type:complete len:117 (-) Transcript_10208:275-625(-)
MLLSLHQNDTVLALELMSMSGSGSTVCMRVQLTNPNFISHRSLFSSLKRLRHHNQRVDGNREPSTDCGLSTYRFWRTILPRVLHCERVFADVLPLTFLGRRELSFVLSAKACFFLA